MLEDTRPEGRFTITPRIDQSFVVVALAPVAEGGWKLSFPRAGGDVEARVGEPLVLRERDRRAAQDWSQLPVLGITLELASAHIEWLDRTGRVPGARSCSDREWERAGRGADSRLYPHGDHLELDDAKARLTLAQKQVDDAQVRAPFSGVVSVRSVSAGDVVQPGGALFTVIDPSSMRLEASVPAAQLTAIRIGSPVTFTVTGYPGKTFQGKVTRINPAADASTGQVRIVASIPNDRNALVAGLFAEGRAQSESRQAPVVVANAVDVRGVRPWVLRLKGGRAEKVEVELGLKDEASEKYEVLKGVTAGDTLLVGAAQGITPGTQVRVSAPNDAAVTKN